MRRDRAPDGGHHSLGRMGRALPQRKGSPTRPRWQQDWQQARQGLGSAQGSAAEKRGAAFSLATAAEYALMLTAADPSPAASVPGQLSHRERD